MTLTQFTRAQALTRGLFLLRQAQCILMIRRLASTEPFRKVFPCEGVSSGIRQAAFCLPEIKIAAMSKKVVSDPRPYIQGFPVWRFRNLEQGFLIYHSKQEVRLKAISSASRSFLSKKETRQLIYERDGYRCLNCGSTENLTIDHIVSLYAASKDKELIRGINCSTNLQTLCRSCNSSKQP